MAAIRSARLPPYRGLRSLLELQASPLPSFRTQIVIGAPRTQQLKSVTVLRDHQARWLSNSSTCRTSEKRQPQQAKPEPEPEPRPRPTMGMILRELRRNLSITAPFRGQSLKKLFHESPGELVMAISMLVAFSFFIAYLVWLYFNYYKHEQFTRFPGPIANSLRRALFYTNVRPDQKLALQYYKQAIEQCDQFGLDPFSDEVMGIKIQVGAWLARIEQPKGAIHVFELMLKDNLKWISYAETTPEKLPRAPLPGTVMNKDKEDERPATQADFDRWLQSSRTRILGKSVAIAVKLGVLYSDEHVLDIDKAHERLVWATETALKELYRRNKEGLKPGEGPWMTNEEIGGTLEALGHSCETKSQFDLALPLFFQALRLCHDPCHSAVLMNNLAATFAQHPPYAPLETTEGIIPTREGENTSLPSPPLPQTRKELLESAERWAQNALQLAKEPWGEQRTQECDQACAVALINLGDIAKLAGNMDEARRRYEQGIEMCKKYDFAPGVTQAQDGLKQLSQ